MSQNWNQSDQAQDAWKRQLLEARAHARDALSECATPYVDNWNPIDVPELVQFLHAQVMDFHRHIEPKADGLPEDMWKQRIVAVTVPETQSIDGGMTNHYGEYDVQGVLKKADWIEKPVALGTLRQEWQLENTVTIGITHRHRATGETITESRALSLHLPPAACEAVIAQLDRCIEDLGWLPEASDRTIGADDVEAI